MQITTEQIRNFFEEKFDKRFFSYADSMSFVVEGNGAIKASSENTLATNSPTLFAFVTFNLFKEFGYLPYSAKTDNDWWFRPGMDQAQLLAQLDDPYAFRASRPYIRNIVVNLYNILYNSKYKPSNIEEDPISRVERINVSGELPLSRNDGFYKRLTSLFNSTHPNWWSQLLQSNSLYPNERNPRKALYINIRKGNMIELYHQGLRVERVSGDEYGNTSTVTPSLYPKAESMRFITPDNISSDMQEILCNIDQDRSTKAITGWRVANKMLSLPLCLDTEFEISIQGGNQKINFDIVELDEAGTLHFYRIINDTNQQPFRKAGLILSKIVPQNLIDYYRKVVAIYERIGLPMRFENGNVVKPEDIKTVDSVLHSIDGIKKFDAEDGRIRTVTLQEYETLI